MGSKISIRNVSDINDEFIDIITELGVLDTPIGRRKISGPIAEEARKAGREILDEVEKRKRQHLKELSRASHSLR